MNKLESASLGMGLVILLIFVYGIRANKGWKYWVFSMLFIPISGAYIGYALGKEEDSSSTDLEPIEI